jgi:hypothetical protein
VVLLIFLYSSIFSGVKNKPKIKLTIIQAVVMKNKPLRTAINDAFADCNFPGSPLEVNKRKPLQNMAIVAII